MYNEDCIGLNGMCKIKDKSVDLVLADLPYGTTQCKWDSIIPFKPLWEQYERIIKDDGAIVLTASQPFTSKLIVSNIELFKYCWYWEKSTPTNFLNANYQPLKKHEDICVFSKANASWSGRKNSMKYFPQDLIAIDKINRRGSSGKNYMHSGKENIQKFTNYPTTKLSFKSDSKKYHSTQKPVALIRYIMRTYSNIGDLVLDNASGSGTLAIAAIEEDRNYICFERDYDIWKKSIERVDNYKSK